MNAKEIIKLNNELREQLNEHNLNYYQDMLTFIRLNSNKSEQRTEEVLLELLEHLLGAQKEGRSAEMVFGEDPEAYCLEIIGEIPAEDTSTRLTFILYIVIQFLAIISLVHGIIGSGMYYFFELGSGTTVFSLGSAVVTILIDLVVLWLFIKLVFWWLKGSTFKKKVTGKWMDVFQLWLICTVSISVMVAIPYILDSRYL